MAESHLFSQISKLIEKNYKGDIHNPDYKMELWIPITKA